MRMRLCALATAQGDGARLLELTTGKHTAPHARPNATQHGGRCSTLYANGCVGVRATAASMCAGASEWPVSCAKQAAQAHRPMSCMPLPPRNDLAQTPYVAHVSAAHGPEDVRASLSLCCGC